MSTVMYGDVVHQQDAVGVAGKTNTAPRSPMSLRQARQQARLALLAEQLGTRDKAETSPKSSSSVHRSARPDSCFLQELHKHPTSKKGC